MADTIPDNLRRLYELGSQHRAWVRTADDVATEEGGRIGPHPSVCDLIERIGRAEAALAAKDAEWQKVLSQSISTSNANVEAAQAECERLSRALTSFYDKWENGVPCTEADGEGNCEDGSPIGNAVKLSFAEEQEILNLIVAKAEDFEQECANCSKPYRAHLLHDGNKCHPNEDGAWFPKTIATALLAARAKAADAVKEKP